MMKLLSRFFGICVFFTILVSFLAFHAYKKMETNHILKTIDNNINAEFYSLTQYLKKYPQTEWQEILNTQHPKNANLVNVLPIHDLPLTKIQITQIEKNEVVYLTDSADTTQPTVVYKKIENSPYAFQASLNFNTSEKAHRFLAWPVMLITQALKSLPEKKWPDFLNNLSQEYGFPLAVLETKDLPSNKMESTRLANNDWLITHPNTNDSSLEIIYAPLFKNKVLQLGPIKNSILNSYEKYFLFLAALIAIQMIVFFIAILFTRSLEKMKSLTKDYEQGRFESFIEIKKSSSLYPIFHNLQSMGKRIRNLVSAKNELTQAVSQELRTPLSHLKTSLEKISRSQDKEDIQKQITSMHKDIHALEGLISEILSYSQIDCVQSHQDLQPVRLSHLLKVIANDSKPDNHSVKTLDDSGDIVVQANEQYITQALKNILQNAQRFAKSIIRVDLEKIDHAHCQLIIEDNGPGIPASERERVFEPFVQLSNQNTTAVKNYGLGLAIAKKIFDQHGWKIFITDSELGGAKFVVKMNTI